MYATHKKYGNIIFHINCDFGNGTYFLFCYHQRSTSRGRFSASIYRKNEKGKYEQILLGGLGRKEDIRFHKRLPRKIKKLLLKRKGRDKNKISNAWWNYTSVRGKCFK